jgi:putative SOS response-associated peptidase YedK
MCGRFTLKTNPSQWGQLLLPELVMDQLGELVAQWQPRYNIAPTQSIIGLVSDQPGEGPIIQRTIYARAYRWGLVPFWADDLAIGNRMINARAETLAEKPAFRNALAKHRCAIPADGYYEWQLQGKTKQPCWIHRDNQQMFAFAGLWDRNRKASEQEVFSATIITANAPDHLAPIHNRMPAILVGEALAAWLDPRTSASQAQEILESHREIDLVPTPVSQHVNNPRHEDPQCIEPVDIA